MRNNVYIALYILELLEVFCVEEMLLSDAGPPPRLSVAAEDLCARVDRPRGHNGH